MTWNSNKSNIKRSLRVLSVDRKAMDLLMTLKKLNYGMKWIIWLFLFYLYFKYPFAIDYMQDYIITDLFLSS